MKKIIHIDMDAFYASVEQRDCPELQDKPVVVGGRPEHRGVVCSASYEARKFGIRSAMPTREAVRLCPQAIFVSPRFAAYKEVSQILRSIFEEVTERYEPLSLDEAYLDVTENRFSEKSATILANYLRSRIRGQTKLTASAGVGPNKFIAKLASSLCKPNGILVVPPAKVDAFVEHLDVEKLWGVGPKTAEKLRRHGIHTTKDVREAGQVWMRGVFGDNGEFLFRLAHGEDSREVSTDRFPKSRSAETTFSNDVRDLDKISATLRELCAQVARALERSEALAVSIGIKVRFRDFQTLSRVQQVQEPTRDAAMIERIASTLLTKIDLTERPIRLLGVGGHDLISEGAPRQLYLFTD